MKILRNIALFATLILAACSDNITDNLTQPDEDNRGVITFASMRLRSGGAGSDDYRAWNSSTDAHTMGVFGWHTAFDEENHMFKNVENTYGVSNSAWQSSTEKWTYATPQYWNAYAGKTDFNFIGYMPYNASATLSKTDNNYTLRVPVTFSAPVLTSFPATCPLLCAEPDYEATTGENVIGFKMDQTLVGYNIQFQLGEMMDRVRDFKVKAVKIYGVDLPMGGSVSRTYTLSSTTWTPGNIAWNVTARQTVEKASAISIPGNGAEYSLIVGTPAGQSYSASRWFKWGDDGNAETVTDGVFYTIPSSDFHPVIEVTYDVILFDEGGNEVVTRNVVSTIDYTKFTGFSTSVTPGHIYPIKVKIVPSYLYVLADEDQVSYIILGE